MWQDHATMGELKKELASLKEEVQEIETLKKEFADFKELARLSLEDQETEAQIPRFIDEFRARIKKQEIRTFLSGRYDKANAILTITAGAGGQDAQDWATMLERMYERYCERRGWKVSLIHQSLGEPGPEGRIGTKQVSLEITGSFAYGFLKKEHGVHRLVRISPFSAQSLRHTSFSSVEVLPQVHTMEEKMISVKPEDLEIGYFRSSGPGGQNVNKRETAVRITHIPTGIVVAVQIQRTQQQNKEKALEILAAKLSMLEEEKRSKELAQLKGKPLSIEWGHQIRSYVLHPYKMVKDHRTDVETSAAERVLDGELDEFIEKEIETLSP